MSFNVIYRTPIENISNLETNIFSEFNIIQYKDWKTTSLIYPLINGKRVHIYSDKNLNNCLIQLIHDFVFKFLLGFNQKITFSDGETHRTIFVKKEDYQHAKNFFNRPTTLLQRSPISLDIGLVNTKSWGNGDTPTRVVRDNYKNDTLGYETYCYTDYRTGYENKLQKIYIDIKRFVFEKKIYRVEFYGIDHVGHNIGLYFNEADFTKLSEIAQQKGYNDFYLS